jgi:thiopeptide-type bacteriocin biosynthesis protein
VQLHNGDLTLRLDLDEPLHALGLREHVDDGKPAVMTRAREPGDYGWIGGHAHEVALPLTRRGEPAPAEMPERLVSVPAARHGELPLAEDSAWLSATLFTARDSMDEIIGGHLPALTASLGTEEVWFIRYRNREETDHLRARIAAGHGQAAHRAAALAAWVSDLRVRRLCARFALDTYYPEVGRYGDGGCMRAAEAVFAADSAVASAQLRHPPGIDPVALAALGMLDIAAAFSGGPEQGHTVAGRAAPAAGQGRRPGHGPDRHHARAQRRAEQLRHTARRPRPRVAAPRRGRGGLPQDPGRERELHPHPRIPPAHPPQPLPGIDRDGEGACRQLTSQAALARRAACLPETA